MIVNQPYDLQLGPTLIAEIESQKYDHFAIMVAYAKLSGVFRLKPSLELFKQNGGKIQIVVGIDQKNTTYDALIELSNIADELYIFHSEAFSQTFHPKCYWLTSPTELWLAVGSNNLTAGGLFSNYEMSYCATLTGNDAVSQKNILETITAKYTNTSSPCCKLGSEELINELLENGYIEKELEQRKRTIAERSSQRNTQRNKNTLFGKEIFCAPALPTQSIPNVDSTINTSIQTSNNDNENIVSEEKEYLIRLIPKAGNRSKQVHYTMNLLREYFMMNPGDSIYLQQMHPNGNVASLETRSIVYSTRNRNVKIEMNGASILDTQYPTDLEKRPVLILKHINNNLYTYMLLMDGDDGYTSINEYLKSLPATRSLQDKIISEDEMFNLWSTCPLV